MEIIDENILGIYNRKELQEIEYYLFNTKYHLINESFTFNAEGLFTLDYLEKIHIFLFSDVYGIDNCKLNIKEDTQKEVMKLLEEIKEMLDFNDNEKLADTIYKLWEYQIFLDGNTRTILCYLKILSKYYDFNITYDFTKDVTEDYFISNVINSIKIKKYF